jgi:adenine-specific DNA-methyltransferase
MPTLDWIGKKAVVSHHREVPFHLLKMNQELSVGEPGNGNLLVQGDNLLALKALLPYYAGKVKCIYIDPPYNTGNENWTYNDSVNSLEIRQWLGKVVGGEMEDLSRHDKWLCMMYPRLCVLREMLSEDGAVFISIDDNEFQNLRTIMDEIFGPSNFVSTIIWQKIYTVKNSAKYLSEMHDYVVLYARSKANWRRNLRPRDEGTDEDYSNPDNDPNGPWISHALQSRNPYSKGTYSVRCPGGRVIEGPPPGTYWRVSETKFWKLSEQGRVWWGQEKNGIPRIKDYLRHAKAGVVPTTFWSYQFAGTNSGAKTSLREIIGDQQMFITPKPVELIQRILELSTDRNSIVLDSFSGSGTTGHGVMQLNKEDGGNRRFILVEMDENICRNVTAERLKRVCNGYTKPNGEQVAGLGDGFRYCELGEPLFAADGSIRKEVSFSDLARHVFFTETGEPLPSEATGRSPLIGVSRETAVYLLYNGILGDRAPRGGNVLTQEVLSMLSPNEGLRVVYGTACRLSPNRLKREGIMFRQIPYQIRVS